MELVPLVGYTLDEKLHIGQRHLLPKQMCEHGLTIGEHMVVTEKALARIGMQAHARTRIVFTVESYTSEAGVRSLERRLAAICRHVALLIAAADGADNKAPLQLPVVIDEDRLTGILGTKSYDHDTMEPMLAVGVACGLAWTAVGGRLMYVETSRMTNGTGQLTLTGQLGDVMRESAQLAMVWLRANSAAYAVSVCSRTHTRVVQLNGDIFTSYDTHVHLPAGAISKDGPSAGITVLVALLSLYSGRRVRADTAVTGEITLRGVLLPVRRVRATQTVMMQVGGIKAKVLAAHRAGIRRVCMPKRNEGDIEDVPVEIKVRPILAQPLKNVL